MGKILTAKEAMAIPGARKCSYGEFQRRRMMTGAVKPKFIGEYLDEHGGRTVAVKYAKVIVTSIVGVPSEDAELAWQGPGVYVVCFDDDCEEFDVTDKKELEWVLEQSPAYSEVQFVDESGFDLGHPVEGSKFKGASDLDWGSTQDLFDAARKGLVRTLLTYDIDDDLLWDAVAIGPELWQGRGNYKWRYNGHSCGNYFYSVLDVIEAAYKVLLNGDFPEFDFHE